MNKYSLSNTIIHIRYSTKLIIGTLLLSSCANQSLYNNQRPIDILISNEDSINNTDNTQEKSVIVSTDNFGILSSDGKPQKGNGSGDIILVLNDHGGNSPRKKSFMLDLSFENENGTINDLTCTDLLNNQKKLTINNNELSEFIEQSKNKNDIQWQVFGILNHYTSSFGIGNTDYINYGLIISEQSTPKKALSYQENHRDKALRANLIIENNRYGIKPNGSLISFSSENSAFTQSLYGKLQSGALASSALNKTMHLNMHRVHINKKPSSGEGFVYSSYDKVGKVKLTFNKKIGTWELILSPK
jgi:hypothetical protein